MSGVSTRRAVLPSAAPFAIFLDLPPLQRLLPPVNLCRHQPVRRQIAMTPAGVKKYAVMCELCGRLVG